MAENTSERLTRLVALIAYLQEHPGVPVQDVAEHFGVPASRVLADINLLWVAGTPGYLPDDLIDFAADELDRDIVTLTNPRGMDRPLRLGATEALALLVAVRSLVEIVDPGSEERELIEGTLAKLRRAAGDMATAAEAVTVQIPPASEQIGRTAIERAIRDRRRVGLRYVSASDEVTEREVSPIQLVADGSRWFLRAWCHRVEAVRHFRLDRILAAVVLDTAAEPAVPVSWARPAPDLTGADLDVELVVTSRARWALERIPGAQLRDEEDGSVLGRFAVVDREWVARAVLELGGDVLEVRPMELAHEIGRRARDALAAYDRLCS